jgi:hypothetical protein
MDVKTPIFTPASLARAIVLASFELQTSDAIFFYHLRKIAFVFDTDATRRKEWPTLTLGAWGKL